MSDIIISKQGEGETFNLYAESSADSSIQISRTRSKSKSRKSPRSYTPEHPPQPSVHQPHQEYRQRPSQTAIPDDIIGAFANPDKKRVEREEVGSESYSQDGDGSVNESQDNYEEYDEEYEEEVPSNGFETIEDEKQDLLYKFYRMSIKGIPVNKKYNTNSDIHEMRREFNRINRDIEVNSSIKFSRRMLMACVTGLEFMNKRYDPFDVKLDGWSESVMENVDDYDNVFERLHDKYKSKVQMAPEIELLLSLTGSAFMFHLTQSMFNNLPNLNDIAKSNPDIIQNLMKTMSQVNTSNTKPSNETPTVDENGQREMKPPMFDMSAVMGMFNPGGLGEPPSISQPPRPPSSLPPPILKTHTPINNDTFRNPPTPVPSRTADMPIINRPSSPSISQVSSSVNDESVQSDDVLKQISFSESATTIGGKRGRKRKTSNPDKTITI